MKFSIKIIFLFVLSSFVCYAQECHISNELIERAIVYSNGHVNTKSYVFLPNGKNFISKKSDEFTFTANDSLLSGNSLWENFNCSSNSSNDGVNETFLSFENKNLNIRVKLTYCVYPRIAAVRKFITIENTGDKDLKIENLNVENLHIDIDLVNAWTFHNYARDIVFGPYTGDWNDPLVILHDFQNKCGLAAGNEAVGVLKKTEAFSKGSVLKIGMNDSKSVYPFRKWISPGESWTSPAAFTILYVNKSDPHDILNTEVQSLVRKFMGTQIEKRSQKPMLVYNTWIPFLRNIDEKLIFELAHAASECGAGEFVIDDGWQINLRENKKGEIFADWGIDTVKFPHGLKPVFDSIKSLGMKPGLWISVANCYRNGVAYSQHPEWIITNTKGEHSSLHSEGSVNPTACMATGWSEYIRDVILSYVRDYGLAYVKLDLAIVTSAYIYDSKRTGCYSTNHKYHHDHNDSYFEIYDRCMKMFDELHEAAPDLFIDCTFETAGKLQLMDYGISEHADGNWLSNIRGYDEEANLRVRNLAWRRTPVLHPTSLVIGNLWMDHPNHILGLKSLSGTLPIMLGDPRKLSEEEKAEFREWSSWLNKLQSKHEVMSFRQDLRGFGEPRTGMWDGFSRINTETKSGGLVGIFRENSVESDRTVVIDGLAPNIKYVIAKGYTGEIVAELTGSELSEKGFKVEIPDKIGGELFEIYKKK